MKLEKFDRERELEKLRAAFPTGYSGSLLIFGEKALEAFRAALQDGSEEALQRAFTAEPYLIQYALPNTGHHGTWVFPKPVIAPPDASGVGGSIPDFLVVGRSSLGYTWFLVELKRATASFANRTGTKFSPEGNLAVNQVNRYLSCLDENLLAVRASLKIPQLSKIKTAIILIGDSAAEQAPQTDFRRRFVEQSPRIDVVTYRRLLIRAEYDLQMRQFNS